jgi:hypothetical protein
LSVRIFDSRCRTVGSTIRGGLPLYCIMYTGAIECGDSESVGATKEEWGESAHCWMGMQVNFILKFIFCDIFLP